MNVIQSVIGPLIMLGVFACVTASSEASLPIRSIAKGGFSGIQEPKQEVITDKKIWEQFWSKHSNLTRPATALPEVDFAKEMVIAVTMGTKRTGGYAVEVVSVQPADKKLKIAVKYTSPPPGAMTIQALTAPFHFVAVPKSDLKAEFVVEAKPASKK
jgi:hypothetical protein